jgi:anthranilate phosphoribosyltransferase
MPELSDVTDLNAVMHSVIQRVATGPELSKSISSEEAHLATRGILDGVVDPLQAAIFFIALRMKRETPEENAGVLSATREATIEAMADVDDLVHLVDPFGGFNKCLPASTFLPAVLAECGVNSVILGLESISPKFGITHHQILRSHGLAVDLAPETAVARIEDPDIGWAYLDQSRFSPKLHALVGLRNMMIKRQVMTTVEVLAKPVTARGRTHFVTGYVHNPYPPKYAALARQAGFDSALLIKGVEGGVVPSLRQAGMVYSYTDDAGLQQYGIGPGDFGIEQDVRMTPIPDDTMPAVAGNDTDWSRAIKASIDAGVAALQGESGPTYDALVYAAAIILHHLGRVKSNADGAGLVRNVLDSGLALKRLC